jgi:hypothetical protein
VRRTGFFSWPVFAVWIIEKSLALPGIKPYTLYCSTHCIETVVLSKGKVKTSRNSPFLLEDE